MTNYDNQQTEQSRKQYLKKYWKISHNHCLIYKSVLQKMKDCIYKLHLTNVYNLSKTF